MRGTHAALAAAGRVLLLGAGPVGIELAGEIKAVWPGKQVTLVDVGRRRASIIVPIGPDGGAGQRAGRDELVPAETVAQLKGRDMMVGRFAELLGLST